MICGLLIFGTPDLPAPLSELSPWLDRSIRPREEVFAQLAAQTHRRFIKSHTPLDGLPSDPRGTYVAPVAIPWTWRCPSTTRVTTSTGSACAGSSASPKRMGNRAPGRASMNGSWTGSMPTPTRGNPSTRWPVMMHVADAGAGDEPNVVLVDYADLSADLDGEMRRMAHRLDIQIPEGTWPSLVEAADFDQMRACARRSC